MLPPVASPAKDDPRDGAISALKVMRRVMVSDSPYSVAVKLTSQEPPTVVVPV